MSNSNTKLSNNPNKNIKDSANRGADGRFIKGNTVAMVYEDDIPDKLELYVNTHINDVKLCSVASFCQENKIHIPTFYGWIARTEDARFDRLRDIHAHFMELQKQQIINGAINRTFDPSFAQFLLKAQHGLRDKQEIQLEGGTDNKLDININVVK